MEYSDIPSDVKFNFLINFEWVCEDEQIMSTGEKKTPLPMTSVKHDFTIISFTTVQDLG